MALTPEEAEFFEQFGIDPNSVSPEDLTAAVTLFLRLGPGGRRALSWLAQNATDDEFDGAVSHFDRAVIRALSQMRRPRIV